MDAPDLIIPIRMDPSKATAALSTVGAGGRAAGDAVAGGAKKAQAGVQELGAGAQQTTKTLIGIQAAQIGFTVIRQSAAAVSAEYKRAADYVKSLANDFADLRKTMQEFATLRGVANSNEFTVEQAKKAQQYGLTPEQYRDFQDEYLNYAGSQVGDVTQVRQAHRGAERRIRRPSRRADERIGHQPADRGGAGGLAARKLEGPAGRR